MEKMIEAIKLAAADCRAEGNTVAANELLDALGQARLLVSAMRGLMRYAVGNDGSREGNPWCKPAVLAAACALNAVDGCPKASPYSANYEQNEGE